ncbi:hypothetical protein D6D00_02969, partial [Aureobasidium pullulans]
RETPAQTLSNLGRRNDDALSEPVIDAKQRRRNAMANNQHARDARTKMRNVFMERSGKGVKAKRCNKQHVRSLEERLAKMEALIVANATQSRGIRPGEAANGLPIPVPTLSTDGNGISDANHQALATDTETWTSPIHTMEPVQKPVNNKESLLSGLPPSIPGAHVTKEDVNALRDNLVQRLPRMQTFMVLPPTYEIFSMVEIYLDDMNAFLPIFHPPSLRMLCRRGMMKSDKLDPLWWACINVIIATTMQSRSTDDGFQKVSEFSWAFFKNAFSVYDDIITSEPSILALQVLLAMAAYLGRTTDLRMAMLLSSTCVHMARQLGLEKESHIVRMPQAESEQRKPDQPLILSAGSIEAGIPDQAPADRLGYFKISGTEQSVNVFDLMIKITAIRSEIYSYLDISTKQALRSPEAQDFILSMQGRVSTWTMELPIDYRPEGTIMVLDLSILILHLTYYDCVTRLRTLVEQSTVPQESNQIGTEEQRAHIARCILDLIRSSNAIPFVYIWQPLQDMFAATIELTSNVIARPASEHALANVKAISSFVRFLETLKYKKGCDLTRLLNGCTILEKVAKGAVMGEQSTHYEAARFLFSCSLGHRLLAQALLTYLPKLDAVCQAASANVFAQSEQRPRNTPLLAPDCMVPSTYNFGPGPSDTSLVDTMRAVYSDVVA